MSQGLAHSHTYGYDTNSCTLCRSSRLAVDTLSRTLKRRVDWTERALPSPEDPLAVSYPLRLVVWFVMCPSRMRPLL